MKHVELDVCFGREKVQSGQVIVNFLCAPVQIVIILTKPLTKKVFLHLRKKLGVMLFIDIHTCMEYNTSYFHALYRKLFLVGKWLFNPRWLCKNMRCPQL